MISKLELAKDLKHCLNLAPYSIPQSVINQQINQLQQCDLDSPSSLKESRALAELVKGNLRFFEKVKVDALFGCEINVVPLPLCVAYSKPSKKSDLIILGSGLLDLICACGYWGNFSESLPESLNEIFPLKDFPTTSVRDAVSVFLFSLLYRYYCFAELLPHLACLAPESIHHYVRHSVAGAASFILFHELGHLQLDHLHDDTLRPMNAALVVDQDLVLYQHQEFEADHYARISIQPEYRPLHTAWINMALSFNAQAETMLSHRSSHHPISLNRLSYANALSEDREITPEIYSKHLDSMGQGFTNIEKKHEQLKSDNKKPLLEYFSREETLDILKQLNKYLKPEGYDIMEAIKNEASPWTETLGLLE